MSTENQDHKHGSDARDRFVNDARVIDDFTGHFLLAMPSIDEGVFEGTLIYMIEHTVDGAAGVIVNRTTDVKLSELLERFDILVPEGLPKQWVHFGGPVQANHGFILHTPVENPESTVLELSSSREILNNHLLGYEPQQALVCFGYAGWVDGQLEQEIRENAWLLLPADTDIIFNKPVHERYDAAFATLGVDIAHFSPHVGHA